MTVSVGPAAARRDARFTRGRRVVQPGMADDEPVVEADLAPGRRTHDFETIYRLDTPPWDIGRPQRAFAALTHAGALGGKVLDVGCGTGEHALLAAGAGLEAVGIDVSPTAISLAEEKAAERGLVARFEVSDALELSVSGERFDTVLDCGLFHVFDDAERARYVESLAAVVEPGGRLYLLCFSEHQPGDWGPRRVRRQELRDCFADGWRVESIEEAVIETTLDPGEARGWMATITKV